jgi:hypothetical protein
MIHRIKTTTPTLSFGRGYKHKGTSDRRNYAGVYYTEFLLVLVSNHHLASRRWDSLRSRSRLGSGLFAVTFVKSVHASRRIYQLLFAGKKRVTLGTYFNVQVTLSRRTCGESIATGAGDSYLVILGVNSWFHSSYFLTCLRPFQPSW